MIFKSSIVKAQWDTWCYYHKGTYYLYYLITEESPGEGGFGVATSKDGVHWEDQGWAIRASSKMVNYLGTGAVWKSVDFEKTGRFICNYSEWRKEEDGKCTQNILFAWSTDLIHWNKFGDEYMFKVDERFYEKYGRWDCIFPMPRPEGGYYGTWTATPKGRGELSGGIGFGYSEDGLHWKALEPAKVVPDANESGAFWRFGNKIYAMFGRTRDMICYMANRIGGPYRQAQKNAVLLHRGHTYFSRFFPKDDEILVNHHVMSGKRYNNRPITYLAPLKIAAVDKEGVLRFKYWKGNDALKGEPCSITVKTGEGSAFPVTNELDFTKGIFAEGNIRIPTRPDDEAVGLYLDIEQRKYLVKIFCGGVVEFNTSRVSINEKGKETSYQVDREWPFGEIAYFCLLARRGMLEFYLDDLFIECWTMGCPDAMTARLGVIGDPNNNPISDLKVYEMDVFT